jgi:hypothetical protein
MDLEELPFESLESGLLESETPDVIGFLFKRTLNGHLNLEHTYSGHLI